MFFKIAPQKHMYQAKSYGFTLIELMVSLSVFAIVMLVSVGTLLILIDANAKAQALDSSTTNLSFALDSITRELRTGYHYYCFTSNNGAQSLPSPKTDTNDCSSGDNSISFTRKKEDDQYGYRLHVADGVIEQKIDTGSWMPITASDIFIDTFEVIVNNSDTYRATGDEEQPTIDLHIVGHAKNNNGLDTATTFNIQTRILERLIDIE